MEEMFPTPPNCETQNYTVLSVGAAKKPNAGGAELTLDTGMRIGDDNCAYDVYLRCGCEEGDFTFDCLVEGNFKYHESIAEGNVRNAWINGCMILYGIIRGLYATMAAQCVHRTLVLPSVMMVDVVNRRIAEMKKAATPSSSSHPPARPDGE